MIYLHLTAFIFGFILDLILGDPHYPFHPIVLIGRMISFFEKILYPKKRSERKEYISGVVVFFLVVFISSGISFLITAFFYHMTMSAGVLAEAVLTWQCLAMKSLKSESSKVEKAINNDDTEAARKAVSMIVGRDTERLDREGIIKAAVETVAENSSDGVIAPMIFLAIAGPVGGFFYKSVNTMDSMIGYKNDRYIYFGRFAAKADDLLNFIPSRITALLLIVVSRFADEETDAARAYKIWKRDRLNHASPNSAQGEAAVAGALGIRLAGDAYYFGKLYKKPFIGDDIRKIEAEDISRTNRLMYSASILCFFICILLMLLSNIIVDLW
ncbi:adenosylcobinamide-phosphate synthase CbiB [Lachnospiraceae bacterium C1.1]|nr:adenosylcobinamide-phosphate synthase CbiB [Lachnospiraceae bacterium C1.1]